jgi:hypothetical protein
MLKRFFIGFLLLLVFFGAVLLWQLPRVVSVLAIPVLESAGLHDVELDIDGIGPGHANLGSLRFRHNAVLFSAQSIRLVWSGTAILDGQLDTLDVDFLEVELSQPGGGKSDFNFDDIDLLFSLLVAPVSELVPVKDFAVGNLIVYRNIDSDQAGKRVLINGNLQLRNELGNAELNAVYRADSSPELAIKASSRKPGEYSASIKTVAGDKLLAVQAQFSDKQLLFDGTADKALLELTSTISSTVLDELEFSSMVFAGGVEDSRRNLRGKLSININDIRYTGYKLEELSAEFPITIGPQEPMFSDGWLGTDSEIAFELSGLDFAEEVQPLDVSLKLERLRYPINVPGEPLIEGHFLIDQITPENEQIPLALNNIEQSFALRGDMLELTGTLNESTRALTITSDAKYSLSSGELFVRINPAGVSFDNADRFADLIAPYDPPIALVTGQMESSFELDWNVKGPVENLTVRGSVEFTNIGGAYNDYYFSGLDGAYSGSVYPVIASDDTSVITVTQLDAGVAVRDLKAVLSLNQLNSNRANGFADGLEVQLFSVLANTMGGYIAIKPAQINFADQQHELSMLLIGIDIDTLLREQEWEEVIASGKLSGEIPLLINDDGLRVTGGRVYAAEPGGKIQYTGDVDALSLAAGPAGFVFEALQDFHYGSMNIYPEYSPDGSLKMRLEVRGNNPQVEQGRPINFNINLEQNLLKLRESLRYVDGLNDEIDEKVQAFYRNNPNK